MSTNSSSGIRAGRAFVELGTNLGPLDKGLAAAKAKLAAFGAGIRAIGRDFALGGASLLSPLAAIERFAGGFEQNLANLRASTNPTIAVFADIREAALRLSRTTGLSPTSIAASFEALGKAGLDAREIINGAGEAAVKFARVGGVEATEAAEQLATSLRVFSSTGISAIDVVNQLSAAADSSAINLRNIVESAQQASSAFGAAGLTLREMAVAVGLLGQAGIRGEEAGTLLKTFLIRLQTGAESAGEAMKRIGLNIRDATGNVVPFREIVARLQASLAGLSPLARDQALNDLLGLRAIRGGLVFLREGVEGWDAFSDKMRGALPVGAKFSIAMGTSFGSLTRFSSAAERAGVAVVDALAPSLRVTSDGLIAVLQGVENFVGRNPQLVAGVALAGAGVLGLGVSLLGLGVAFKVAAFGVGGLHIALGLLSSPALLIGGLGVAALIGFSTQIKQLGTVLRGSFSTAVDFVGERFGSLVSFVREVMSGVSAAIARGDTQAAANVLWAGLRVAWEQGAGSVLAISNHFAFALTAGLTDAFFDIVGGARLMMADLAAILDGRNLRAAFNGATGFLSEGLQSMIVLLNDALGGDNSVALSRLQNLTAQHQQDSQVDSFAKSQLAEDLAAEKARIIRETEAARKPLIDAIEEDFGDRVSAAADDLARAREELRKSIADAGSGSGLKIARFAGVEDRKKNPPPGTDDDDLSRGAAKFVSIGTFNAAAVFGLGAGGVQERTAKAAEETAEGIARLLPVMLQIAARGGGLV